MNLRLLILIIFSVLVATSATKGQITQPQRFETTMESGQEYHRIFSAEKAGLMLYREKEDRAEGGMKRWEFSAIDTSLDERWTKLLSIDYKLDIVGYAYSNANAFFLLKNSTNPKEDFTLIKMDVLSGDTIYHLVKQLIPMDLTHFEIVGNAALIGGMINQRPTIVHYDMRSRKSKVIPGIYKGESQILELKVDPETETFNVLITEKTLNRYSTITLMSFTEDGVLLQNTRLEPEDEKSLIFAGSTPFKEDEIMVTGTYSHKRSAYSRGVFIARVDSYGNQEIAYYSYADLENFFKYMPARREARVQKRIERSQIKGKKAKFTYRLLVRDVIEKEGNYVMVGEAFYPRYYNSHLFGAYSSPFRGYRASDFVGYKFTHAIVIGFNSEGEVLWDNSFEINDVESYSLNDEVVNIGIEGDRVVLLYLYDGEIRSKIITGGEVIEGESSEDIRLNSESQVVKSYKDQYGGLEAWYDNYFFAYGVQRIKNKESSGIEKEVFFINKISF